VLVERESVGWIGSCTETGWSRVLKEEVLAKRVCLVYLRLSGLSIVEKTPPMDTRLGGLYHLRHSEKI
jgi:hypothetical protein